MTIETTTEESGIRNPVSQTPLSEVVIRFAGDSGDGMQITGTQFTSTSALVGNDLSTLPDFPAEIRAQVSRDALYAQYIERQKREVAALKRDEAEAIPPDFDYAGLDGLT